MLYYRFLLSCLGTLPQTLRKCACQERYVIGGIFLTSVATAKTNNFSALITLYEHDLKSGQSNFALPVEKELHALARDGMEALVPVVSDYSVKMQTTLPFNTNQVSPLVINCLYRMASWLSRTIAAAPRDDYSQALMSITQGLRKLESRWKVAGKI